MKKTTKILSIILALVMILSAIPVAVSAEECSHVDANKDHLCDDCSKELYVERSWSGLEKKELYTEVMVNKTLKEIPSNAAAITSETTTLEGGFYYVSGEVNVATRITVNGTADNPTCIILKDGCSFNAESGITVLADNVLYIYGQIRDSGTLTASGVEVKAAGIGGERDKTKLVCGTVTVFGGNVVAYGSTSSAGIGGSATTSGGAGGTVTVYGGTVEAYGGNWNNESGSTGTGAGIGGGLKAAGGSFTIYGGYVKAVSNAYGAGIGGGKGGAGGTFTMYDGEVFAYADNTESFLQPAIGNGGGSTTSSGTITVNCAYFAEAYYNFVQIQPPYSGEPWSSDTSDFAKYSYAHIKFAHNHDTVAEETTDNGDGTHSGKCICGESITPDEAHTFVDGFCTACGAADPSAPAHEHSFSKSWAKNETAHWHECTAEDCDIEDYATCGIAEAAYGEHADADGNFYCDACNYFFAVAFYKEKFKADIKDNLLPAAVCDEAREILNKAYEDLDTAVTINDVQSIYNTAKGMSGGKNSDFTSKLNSYKSTITINLGDSPAAARDNFVENTINALENSQSIAELDKAFNNGTSQISYYKSTDANVNAFNNKINSGELSDKSIALAQEAIEKINEAKTYEEVSALSNQYHGKIDTQIAKEKASAELNTIAEEKNDSRVDAIVSEALAAIDEATAVMDINDIKAEAIAAIEALPTEPAGDVKKVVCEPGADEYRTFAATVENHAVKIQIVDESGSTVTFTRDNPKVSIRAYDADGNEVAELDKTAAYEVWTVSNQYLKEGKYTIIAKNSDNVWDSVEDGCEFDVVYSRDDVAVIAVIPSVIEAKRCEKFDVEVATGGDVLKVTIQYNGVNYKTFTPSGKNNSGMNIFDCFVAADTYGDAKITVRYKTADGWFDCTDVYDIVSIGNVTTPRCPL